MKPFDSRVLSHPGVSFRLCKDTPENFGILRDFLVADLSNDDDDDC